MTIAAFHLRLSIITAVLLLAAPIARADTIYTDGPTNGTFSALTINNGVQTEDSFTVAATSTLTSVTFGDWVTDGDQALSIEWAIVPSEGSQTPVCSTCSGTANLTGVLDTTNSLAKVYDETFSLPDITLAPGTYWLELQDELLSEGDAAYWDINGGPSMVWNSAVGDLSNNACNVSSTGTCSNAFTIYGTVDAAATPEPGSLTLFGAAAVVIATQLRRRIRTNTHGGTA